MKNTLLNFPFDHFSNNTLDKAALSLVRTNASWLLPQLLAFLGSNLRLARNETDKFSFKASLKSISSQELLYEGTLVPPNVLRGMIRIILADPRGNILNATTMKQTAGGSRYNAGVPLLLSAFKEYRNIPYMAWDWTEPEHRYFLDKSLLDVVPYFFQPLSWDDEELLDFRNQANTQNKAVTALTAITVVSSMEFKQLPRLLKLMLCQAWVYHPSLRHKYMITSTVNLDEMPESLVSGDVLFQTKEETNNKIWRTDKVSLWGDD